MNFRYKTYSTALIGYADLFLNVTILIGNLWLHFCKRFGDFGYLLMIELVPAQNIR